MGKKIFCGLILAMLLLAACAGPDSQSQALSSSEPPPPASRQESASSSKIEAIPAPAAELTIPGQITIYVRNPGSDIFTPHVIPMQSGGVTLLELVTAVGEQLQVEIPVRSITQQKGMVVIDLAGPLIGDFTKEQIEQILTTLAITLQQNHRSFEWIQYQLDGEVGVFGREYPIPPLKLLEETPEEFAAIRAQIPYGGLRIFPVESILETDDTGNKLAEYLSLLDLPNQTITSVAEIKNSHILKTAVFATQYYETYPDSEVYLPELKPFEAPASQLLGFSEQWFWLKEHVEESARRLYGEGVSLTHESFGKYRYLELLGVYTPPHMGGGGQTIPVLFEYEDLGDRIRAQVAYVTGNIQGYQDPETWEDIPQDQLEEYARTKSARYEVTVRRTGDDWFLLESQKPVGDSAASR